MRTIKRTAALVVTLGLMFSPVSANAANTSLKSMPLTDVLNLPQAAFDKNSADFDIFTNLFIDVWGQIPDSPIQAIANGNTALTAFVPTDGAFRNLVKYLTGKTIKSEQGVATAVLRLGAPTVEKVILYHVIVGDPILSPAALQANGASLKTASGETVNVKVSGTTITLVDKVAKHRNPTVILGAVDINKGNKQVAHGINQVLLPTLK